LGWQCAARELERRTGKVADTGRSAYDRLRQQTDHGSSGDKVDFIDPAAAPLGTDAEAGGFPSDEAAVERAMAYEAGGGARGKVERPRTPADLQQADRGVTLASMWKIAAAALVVLVVVIFLALL
jgi:hypothetical protein